MCEDAKDKVPRIRLTLGINSVKYGSDYFIVIARILLGSRTHD